MAFPSRTDDTNRFYANVQDNIGTSINPRGYDDRYTTSEPFVSRYVPDSQRTDERFNENLRRPGDNNSAVQHLVMGPNRPGTGRPSGIDTSVGRPNGINTIVTRPNVIYEPSRPTTTNNVIYEPSRPTTTTNVIVDSNRRPARGNPNSCVIEVNIAVSFGHGRYPRTALATSSYPSRPAPIRSQVTIDDVNYVDIAFRSPERTARISTDGIIHNPTAPRRSVAFPNENEY